MPQKPESRIVKRCLEFLLALPRCEAHKIHGSEFTRTGEPDIDACLNGRSLKIEVKQPGQKPTAIQQKRLGDWAMAGAWATFVTSDMELASQMVRDELISEDQADVAFSRAGERRKKK